MANTYTVIVAGGGAIFDSAELQAWLDANCLSVNGAPPIHPVSGQVILPADGGFAITGAQFAVIEGGVQCVITDNPESITHT